MTGRPFPWRVALFASLAVNLLAFGAVAGGYAAGWRLDRPHVGERADRHGRRGGFLRALPKEERAQVRAELRQSWRETGELRAKARAARDEVRRVASVENYDAAAVTAALARMRAADADVQAAWHESVARSLSRLSAEHRRAAIEAFIKERTGPMGRRMRDRRGWRGERERPPDESRAAE